MMRSKILTCAIGLLTAGVTLAQDATIIPLAAITTERPLTRDNRAAYLVRQLDLSDEQRSHAQGLIDIHYAEDQPQLKIDEVTAIWKQLEEAEKAGNQAEKERLTAELRALGRQADNEPEFLEMLKKTLTDAQKTRLDAAVARLNRNPSGAIRPVDLVAAARTFELSEQQQRKLNRIVDGFRDEMSARVALDDSRKYETLNSLNGQIREMLEEAQRTKYDGMVKSMGAADVAPSDASKEGPARRGGRRRANQPPPEGSNP